MLNKVQFKRLQELKSKKDLTTEEVQELKELKALAKRKDAKGKGSKREKAPWGNDFSWWNKYPDLLRDASNIAQNWIPGTGFSGVSGEGATIVETAGALAINVANMYGCEDSATGPINVQARNIWLAMHRKYRGIQTYQAADIGAVLIAGVELVALLAEIERLYGVINYYSVENRNLPFAVLRAMGISTTLADNIRQHLADFRYGINQLIMRAQNVLIPKDMSVIANKISLFGYLYADHLSKKAQIYVFKSVAYGQFNATLPGGSAVVFDRQDAISGCSTYEDVINILTNRVEALVSDDDVNKIYSDLLAYLGNEQFLTINLLPEAYVVVPQYDESILHKIHNIKSLGFSVYNDGDHTITMGGSVFPTTFTHQTSLSCDPMSWHITQSDNVLCTKVSLTDELHGDFSTSSGVKYFQFEAGYFVPSELGSGRASLLDTYDKPMDELHITEGVLLKHDCETKVSAGEYRFIVSTCAFELVCGFEGFVNRKGTVTGYDVCQYSYYSGYMDNAARILFNRFTIQSLLTLSQYDWAPVFYALVDDDVASIFLDDSAYDVIGSSPNNVAGVSFGSDIDICRFVKYEEMYRVHDTCVLSGFYTTAGATSNTETK